MFSTEEMATIRKMVSDLASIEEIADALSIHRVTLERRLMKFHALSIEPKRACRLVSLTAVANSPAETVG